MLKFKEFLTEMPQIKQGTEQRNPLNDTFLNQKGNSRMYATPILRGNKIGTLGNYDIHVYHDKGIKQHQYRVLDHDNKQVLFMSNLNTVNKNKEIPFKHVTQEYVSKRKDAPLSGVKMVYDLAVEGQKHPLVSDAEQYKQGNEMWKKLVSIAHDKVHHSYHLHNGVLTKITPENKDEIFASSYGHGPEYQKHRYVISKKEL